MKSVVPAISSISPTKGRQGSNVTINGSNFGSKPVVMVDGTVGAKVVSASDTKIVVTMPTGMKIGKHKLTVVSNGNVSNGVEFIDP